MILMTIIQKMIVMLLNMIYIKQTNKTMNAKEEFLGHIKDRKILCADMSYQDCWRENPGKTLELSVRYTQEQYDEFVNSLDFEYDKGYGGQELFGIIWYTDGTWSDRGEYDGSEWWSYQRCPNIPEKLLNNFL